jgi:hypothetical protein
VVITGPIATPFLGGLLPTRKLLGLSDDEPLPLTRGLGIPTNPPASPAASDCTPPTLTDTLSPTSVSLMPCPRPWIDKIHGSQLLPSACSEGKFATILDSLDLFESVCVFDARSFIHSWIGESKPDPSLSPLWSPATISKDGPAADSDIASEWFNTCVIPPDTATNWPSTFPLDAKHLSTAHYQPFTSHDTVNIYSPGTPQESTAGFMLLLCFLHFPALAAPPVGLVMHPDKVTISKFCDIINFLAGHNDRRKTARWLRYRHPSLCQRRSYLNCYPSVHW